MLIQARIAQLVAYRLGSNPGKGDNFSVKVICNVCVLMTETLTIEGGQKDALLGRANLKKTFMLK